MVSMKSQRKARAAPNRGLQQTEGTSQSSHRLDDDVGKDMLPLLPRVYASPPLRMRVGLPPPRPPQIKGILYLLATDVLLQVTNSV